MYIKKRTEQRRTKKKTNFTEELGAEVKKYIIVSFV